MTQLALARPGPDAPPDVVSAWYAAKARLHAHLASTDGPERARAVARCAKAQRRAETVLTARR
ncbi:hypothetical protein [Gordonia sp. (in: high G+C Gram-positive bacteria)]|uniref:hypothetical protein n=1 Tax=Gordonia sp. (in: high G+C Gram-positive bacteria) TaxID=84139 RepID=UPI0039E318FB